MILFLSSLTKGQMFHYRESNTVSKNSLTAHRQMTQPPLYVKIVSNIDKYFVEFNGDPLNSVLVN